MIQLYYYSVRFRASVKQWWTLGFHETASFLTSWFITKQRPYVKLLCAELKLIYLLRIFCNNVQIKSNLLLLLITKNFSKYWAVNVQLQKSILDILFCVYIKNTQPFVIYATQNSNRTFLFEIPYCISQLLWNDGWEPEKQTKKKHPLRGNGAINTFPW
jgi:hypothetical protein